MTMAPLRSNSTRNIWQYHEIHSVAPQYGKSSERLLGILLASVASGKLMNRTWDVNSILDFGCGKSSLVDQAAAAMNAKAHKYDPAISEHSILKVDRVDLVINTDVLEHLDEHEIGLILTDISGISRNVFFNIATVPATTILPNGENAHATVQPDWWWKEKLGDFFPTVTQLPSAPGRATFVTWKVGPIFHAKQKISSRFRSSRMSRVLKKISAAFGFPY
jgi:hypothetical protein